ncbi:MAG: dihydropteroate synthase [Rikenellaceae bacterium]|nr:dihydropteroate synthase [Rikenellaceae bacterium]
MMRVNTTLQVGDRLLDLSVPVVMGIVNVTPDSFFSGSRSTTGKQLRERIDRAVGEGAGILDVGGYSSRPGAAEVSPEEEFRRVEKALETIRTRYPDAVVSLDTFRARVVEKIVSRYGAVIVNDISSGELDPEMIPTVARLNLPYLAMHMRGTPSTMQSLTDYQDVTAEVIRYFSLKLEGWVQAGIDDIILDPGFGFAKTVEQNFELLGRLSDLRILGRPLLAGISRKTMIWKTLGITPEEALNGTTALHWECLRQGAGILRAHDVRQAVEAVRLYQAFDRSRTKDKPLNQIP